MEELFDVGACIQALKGKNDKAWRRALDSLEGHGEAARSAVPALIAFSVNNSINAYRNQAKKLLPTVDPNWRSHESLSPEVLSLTFLLDDYDKELGARAEAMLTAIGPKSFDYVVNVAIESDEDRRAAANRVLNGIDPNWQMRPTAWSKAEEVLEKMESENEEVVEAAEEILKKMGKGAVPTLLSWLVSPLRKRRKVAHGILEGISEDWQSLVPVEEIEDTLLPNLNSGHDDVVEEVRRILFGMGDRALPFLTDALEPHASTSTMALLHIVQLTGKMWDGDDRLQELLLERWPLTEKTELRAAIILALHRTGYNGGDTLVGRLIQELEHPADEVKMEAISYLEFFGPAAESASYPLAVMLSSNKDELVAAVRQALSAIGIAAGPALATLLNDNDREEILKILQEYESTFTTSELERVKLDPVRALRNMGWNVAFAKDAMARLAQRKMIAMELIDENGYQGQELIGFLQKLLDSDNEQFREMAKKLYQKLTFF